MKFSKEFLLKIFFCEFLKKKKIIPMACAQRAYGCMLFDENERECDKIEANWRCFCEQRA